MPADRVIQLRGVEVHNLKQIDLDLPRRRLIVCCGVSGSGKSSLAFDTLYAEGQRRYIESFSAYTRQFLERLEKPAAERIDGIPPAIAVARQGQIRNSRSTVGTATETIEYLRLLLAKLGQVVCHGCGLPVRRDSPQSVAQQLAELPSGQRLMLGFWAVAQDAAHAATLPASLVEDGFVRVMFDGQPTPIAQLVSDTAAHAQIATAGGLGVIVDRLTTGQMTSQRLRDSVETAFTRGQAAAYAWLEETLGPPGDATPPPVAAWRSLRWSAALRCEACQLDYAEPDPRLLSFNSPLGACPACEGFGNTLEIDWDLVVPDRGKSLRQGAIAPWNTPAYAHELQELLALADEYLLPVDVPVSQLTEPQWQLVREGVPERKFGGLRGFFAWLERRKYKMHIRVFLSRWRSHRPCPVCHGARLRPEALAVRLAGRNLAELTACKVSELKSFVDGLKLSSRERAIAKRILEQVTARLTFLEHVGLGYLTLDRPLRTLSGGEAQRATLTSALGSSLVDVLYVLDEPSVGLHPRDTDRLVAMLRSLRDRGNTVLVVEHDESVLRSAEQVVEIGPGAGEHGGRVVFQGTPQELAAAHTVTADFLSGRRGAAVPQHRRPADHGWIRLTGARGHNLQNLTVEFPLGVLCVVTGVSGSGKSTLVQDTLYPALCRRMRKEVIAGCECDDVFGDGQVDDVVLVDQSPIGRSPRSNPVTYLKAFDEIRAVFAETLEARARNYSPSHFSFNAEEGRCATCQGDGYLEIDMQFLADISMRCDQCGGTRYRPEILDITYRGRNIAEVLEMTVREAFTFFRNHTKVQSRLKRLMDVGLDYLRLGQRANTLSGGETQRLKLAGYLSSVRRGRCLFLMDEPTTGLHFADVSQLLDCFDQLLAVGHSLIVVEHNLSVIKTADYLIDLGPEAAEGGGRVVACGTPELVARNKQSITAGYLRRALAAAKAPPNSTST